MGCGADCGEAAGLPVAGAGAGGNFEFFEMTPDGHLRHSRFVGLREDKKARDVRRKS